MLTGVGESVGFLVGGEFVGFLVGEAENVNCL